MEGVGPEIENMVFSDYSNDSTNKEGETKQEDKKESEAVQVNGEAEKGNGVLSNFISAYVSSREKEDQEVEGVEGVNRSDAFDEENKVEKEGGLLNHLISMVTPNQDNSNTKSEEGESDLSSEVESGKNGVVVEDKDGGGGGVIHNLISHILHPNNGENSKIGKDEQVIEDGGGIVGNGDPHLPLNNEDARRISPEIEEASMLIHSIVHD